MSQKIGKNDVFEQSLFDAIELLNSMFAETNNQISIITKNAKISTDKTGTAYLENEKEISKLNAALKKQIEVTKVYESSIKKLTTEVEILKKAQTDNNKATENSTKQYKEESKALATVSKEIDDLTKANKELNKAQVKDFEQIEANKLKIKELRVEYNQLSKEQTQAKVSTELLTKFIDTQNLSMNELMTLQKGLTVRYNVMTEEMRLNSIEGKTLTAQLSLISTKLRDGDEAIGKFNRSVGDYKTAITKSKTELSDLILKQNALNTENKQGTQEYKDIQLAIINTTAKIVKYTSEVRQAELGVEKLTGANKKSSLSFKEVIAGTAIGGGVANLIQTGIQAVGQELKDQVTNITTFETAMKSLSSITGAVGDDLQYMQDQAIVLSEQTGIAAVEIVNSYKLVGSAMPSLLADTKLLAEVTDASIILSQASGETVESSATAVTAAMQQFGISASEANRVINTLAAGSLAGSAEVGDLTLSFKNVGTVAADSNLSLEQTIATLEVLAEKQIFGAEAGTQLKGALSKLKAEGLGYESGVFNMTDAVNEANIKMAEFGTEAEKDAYKAKIFGLENQTAGTILLENIDKVAAMTNAVTGQNTAYDQAATNTDTLTTKLNILKETYNSLFLEAGTKDGGFAEQAKQIIELATALLTAGKESKDLELLIKNITGIFEDLFGVLGEVFSIFSDGTDKVSMFEGILKVLSTTTEIALIPIRLLVGAFEVAIDVIKWIGEKFENLSFQINYVVENSEFLTTVFEKVKDAINFMIAPYKFLIDQIKQFLVYTGVLSAEIDGLMVKTQQKTVQANKWADIQAKKATQNVVESVETITTELTKLDDVVETIVTREPLDIIGDVSMIDFKGKEDDVTEGLTELLNNTKETILNEGFFSFILDDELMSELQNITDITVEALNTILDAAKENTQKQIDLRDKNLADIEADLTKQEDYKAQSLANGIAFNDAEILRLQEKQAKEEKLKEEQTAKLKKQMKIQWAIQSAADEAKAISALMATSLANPLNSVTFGSAGMLQWVAGIAEIGLMTTKAIVEFNKIDSYGKGGIIRGASHNSKDGGVLINAEGGEFITPVLQTQRSLTLLNAIRNNELSDKDFVNYQNNTNFDTSKIEKGIDKTNFLLSKKTNNSSFKIIRI